MSNWFQPRPTSTKFVAALLAAAFFFTDSGAAACNNNYATAVELLQALYSDLKGKNVTIQTMTLQLFDNDKPPSRFAIGISELHPTEPITVAPNPPLPSSAERVGHLSTHFEFDARNDQLVWMSASGSYVSSDKEEQLSKRIDEHPNWSEREITDALSAAGAQFGPNDRDAVVAIFPKKLLEPILGKIEIQSVKFDFGANDENHKGSAVRWSVRFRASKGQNTTQYFALLEPFDGKIVLLGSTPFKAGPVRSQNPMRILSLRGERRTRSGKGLWVPHPS